MNLRIPRHACSPRDHARAGDLWRLVQEVAVIHSTECGWPPERYRELGTGFVVREITGVHLREARYGEQFEATTWVGETRREMLMRRETRLAGVLRATAEWVHVGSSGGPARAPKELASAFPVVSDDGPGARLPEFDPVEEIALPELRVVPWWTEMDPMGHVNHPRYVDWAEEWVSAWLGGRGVDPVGLVAVAEKVRYRSAAVAGDDVRVRGALVGFVGDAAVFRARASRGEDTVCDATLVRRHLSGPSAWA
ncbi:MAG: thioesterase family protein [Myxococcota bacterium]